MNPADCLLVGFKRHLRVETVPAEAVYLMSERGVTALSGSCIETLAPLLDGTRDVAQVLREVSPELAAAEVEGLLVRLSEASLLDFRLLLGVGPQGLGAAVSHDGAAAAYWNVAGLDADSAASALDAATVEIVALGRTDAAAAAAMCGASGLAWRDEGDESAAVSLVLCEDYLDPRL